MPSRAHHAAACPRARPRDTSGTPRATCHALRSLKATASDLGSAIIGDRGRDRRRRRPPAQIPACTATSTRSTNAAADSGRRRRPTCGSRCRRRWSGLNPSSRPPTWGWPSQRPSGGCRCSSTRRASCRKRQDPARLHAGLQRPSRLQRAADRDRRRGQRRLTRLRTPPTNDHRHPTRTARHRDQRSAGDRRCRRRLLASRLPQRATRGTAAKIRSWP